MNTTIECLTLTDLNNYMPYLIFWFILHILSFILAIFHIFGDIIIVWIKHLHEFKLQLGKLNIDSKLSPTQSKDENN